MGTTHGTVQIESAMLDSVSSRVSGSALLGAWIVFATANVFAMWLLPGEETIPFHFIWISLALVFGLRAWSRRNMIMALVGVTSVTSVVLVHHASIGAIGIEESAEVPLMAAVYLVMVWHVNRRQELAVELSRLVENEKLLAESQRLFVRSGSHELRTPITVARGYVELIRAAHSDTQTADDTEIVLEELGKLDLLTARLATLVELEYPPLLTWVDLDAVLDKTIRRWTPVADRDWHSDGSVGSLFVDLDRVDAMLDSLIENAVKFTGPGDRIELTARRMDSEIILEVADTGEGIPDTDLVIIFDRFRSGSTAGDRAGSGLGLAIARAAAEARGGTLSVRSKVGHGSTFTARIPERAPFGSSSSIALTLVTPLV